MTTVLDQLAVYVTIITSSSFITIIGIRHCKNEFSTWIEDFIPRSWRRRPNRITEDPFLFNEQMFIKTYRLTKDLAKEIIDKLATCIQKERRKDGLSVQEKVSQKRLIFVYIWYMSDYYIFITFQVLITLAFYATGSYQIRLFVRSLKP